MSSSFTASTQFCGLKPQAWQQIHMDQLKCIERFIGRAAMLGIVIGVIVEGLTGFGIANQIGLGSLVDGYSVCRTLHLPFYF